MNLFAHSVRSKGSLAFVRRIGTVAVNFGVTPAKTEQSLNVYLQTLQRWGYSATFPITAVVLQRHAPIIRRLSAEGVEFAVHGYAHTDHTTLSAWEQRTHVARAIRIFAEEGIPADGFRSPYLRYNDDTLAAVEELGLDYISNEVVSFPLISQHAVAPERWLGYQKALSLYSAIPADSALVRPRMRGRLVEIPVAMPDDEILVDRLGLTNGERIGQIWAKLVDETYRRQDLLTLQLHPERGRICRVGLTIALAAARAKPQPVWMAQLREIARWWRRRAEFRLTVETAGTGQWKISSNADSHATVLVRNVKGSSTIDWDGSSAVLEGGSGIVECPVRPVIGVSHASAALQDFLREEGYPVVDDSAPNDCALFFDRPGALSSADQVSVLRRIEHARVPLVRFSRWPDGARSAVAVTGDIDAMTLGDFVRRTWEVL